MRYYIYLDRALLRILFSALSNIDFDIEVVEYSVRKSYSTNNQLSVDPSMEKIKDCENSCREEIEKDKSGGCRSSCLNKERVGFGYDYGNSYNLQTEKRYINIEDITDMKNTSFYHNLLENLRSTTRGEEDRVIEEEGYIKCGSRAEGNPVLNENFFMVNDTFIWFNQDLLQGDITLLSEMACKVKVIGYQMNCKEDRGHKIVKAISIFIE